MTPLHQRPPTRTPDLEQQRGICTKFRGSSFQFTCMFEGLSCACGATAHSFEPHLHERESSRQLRTGTESKALWLLGACSSSTSHRPPPSSPRSHRGHHKGRVGCRRSISGHRQNSRPSTSTAETVPARSGADRSMVDTGLGVFP